VCLAASMRLHYLRFSLDMNNTSWLTLQVKQTLGPVVLVKEFISASGHCIMLSCLDVELSTVIRVHV